MLRVWKETKGYFGHLLYRIGVSSCHRLGKIGGDGRMTWDVLADLVSHKRYRCNRKIIVSSGLANTFTGCGLVECFFFFFSEGLFSVSQIYFIFLRKAIWWACDQCMCVYSLFLCWPVLQPSCFSRSRFPHDSLMIQSPTLLGGLKRWFHNPSLGGRLRWGRILNLFFPLSFLCDVFIPQPTTKQLEAGDFLCNILESE